MREEENKIIKNFAYFLQKILDSEAEKINSEFLIRKQKLIFEFKEKIESLKKNYKIFLKDLKEREKKLPIQIKQKKILSQYLILSKSKEVLEKIKSKIKKLEKIERIKSEILFEDRLVIKLSRKNRELIFNLDL